MMTKFQNIKFYVLCRHKLNVPGDKIFSEINRLFGTYLNRSYGDSVGRWIKLYASEPDPARRIDHFSFSRRNRYAMENLKFRLHHDLSEPNSIQKKKFYSMCRYQLHATQTEICAEMNEIFDEDALYVINEWIEQCWSMGNMRPFIQQNKMEYIRLTNYSNSVDREEIMALKAQLEECRQQLTASRCQTNLVLEEKKKLELKLMEEVSLAKKYWESCIVKLNTEISDLKSANSKLECDLYEMSMAQLNPNHNPNNNKSKSIKECGCSQINSQNLNEIIQTKNLLTDYTLKEKQNLMELNKQIEEKKNEIKTIKFSSKRKVRRTSKLIAMNRVKLREVYFNKLKYLIKRMEKTEYYMKSASKILKLQQLQQQQQHGNFFFQNNIKYEASNGLELNKIKSNGLLQAKLKFEKYEAVANF